MQFTFIDMTGKTLFIRDDAERATWTQEEMTLELLFPYVDGKACSIGQRVYFTDPSTGSQQVYEIKQVNTYEPDHYQQVTAEHICISELSDEHIDKSDIENESCSTVLSGLLSGTLWTVGNIGINPVSSVSVSRGSVWQAVLQVKDNWNVYIEPRVTFSSDGTIGRYLDIKSTAGEWNGVRLSVDKNFLDPSVTYDDSEVATALYGYGGTILDTTAAGEDHECNFADVVWTATADHPAKPAGQTYIEDPAATAEFGRNGRARFGFYQNTDITDPATLLQKTWEALKTSETPSISIEGSVEDLYRMGYADQPIKLHDIALVEVLPAGFKKQIQIIKITTDLLDPSSTMLTIGDYIPNIVYIERKTNESATGSRGGGGRNKSNETERHEFETAIETIDAGTGIRFRAFQNDLDDMDNELKLQEGRITVAYNKIETEVVDRRNADGELAGRITVQADRITQEVTRATGAESGLSGRITTEAGRITQEVTDRTNADTALSGRITTESNRISLVVQGTGANAKIKAAQIVASINAQTGSSTVEIDADKVNIGGTINLADAIGISSGGQIVNIKKWALFSGDIWVDSGKSISLFNGSEGVAITYGALSTTIKDASVSGNTLTLTRYNGETVTFNKAVSLSGEWNSTTYSVSATSGTISGTAPTTTVYLEVEGTPNPNATVYAKIYKDNPTVAANQLASTQMTLGEYVAGKYVELYTGSGTSKIQRGKVSTVSTYNAGWDYGLTLLVTSGRAAESQEQTVKSLSLGERWTVLYTKTASDGTQTSTPYTVAAPSNPYPQTKTMKCTGKTFTSGEWVYTFEYHNSSNIFNTSTNYKFHNNSNYS